MKKIFSCMVAIAAIHTPAFACNMCGCSSSNQYLGLLPQNNYNFAGFQYLYRSFKTVHPEDGSTISPGTSYEQYRTFQLWGRVNVTKRLQLIAFVPFVGNVQKQDGIPDHTTSGIGDIPIVANYKFIDKDGRNWSHKLFAGGGVKAPVGKYDPQSVVAEEGLPNMQPGTHSWDFIAIANYTIKHKTAGLNMDLSYVATTANKEDYKFGNRFSAGPALFYEWKKNGFSILPQAGLRYDHAAKDYETYSTRTKDEDGGGWQLYAAQGAQAYYKQFGLQAMCYEPVSQHYASGMVTTKFRVETGIVVTMK